MGSSIRRWLIAVLVEGVELGNGEYLSKAILGAINARTGWRTQPKVSTREGKAGRLTYGG